MAIWLLKLLIPNMRALQLSVDPPTVRSELIASRRNTRSQRSRSNRSTRISIEKHLGDMAENEEQLDIYFNQNKRKCYFKNVIDNYFLPIGPPPALSLQNSEPDIALLPQEPPLLQRQSHSSESSRGRPRQILSISRLKLKNRISVMGGSWMGEVSSLPIIEEGSNVTKRPVSEHKSSSLLSDKEKNKDMTESLFLESNKSFIEKSSSISPSDSFKFISIRKEGKRVGKIKAFNASESPHLQRQLAAKKTGMNVAWKLGADNRSLEYPPLKKLRELVCSQVQQRTGEQPLTLITPTPYYYSLFANNCQELTDIVIELVRGVVHGKGLIANHQLNPNNIVRLAQKKFTAIDWGCASVRESFTVQGRSFNKDLPPIIREDGKWMVSPQYLAPQMLRASLSDSYSAIWLQKGGVGSCDVWSIGCLLLELITLIPLGCVHYCQVKGRERRRGILGCRIPTAENILSRQRNFKGHAIRLVREENRARKDVRVTEKLMEILPRMLEESVENRISAQQILTYLI